MVVLAVMQCVTNSPSLPVPYAHTMHLARSGILRMLRVWAKRSSGQYWPTICHGMGGGLFGVLQGHVGH